jgi:hypothetical protein
LISLFAALHDIGPVVVPRIHPMDLLGRTVRARIPLAIFSHWDFTVSSRMIVVAAIIGMLVAAIAIYFWERSSVVSVHHLGVVHDSLGLLVEFDAV